MKTYKVKVTWVQVGTNNASMAGLDHIAEIDAADPDSARREAIEDAINFTAEGGRSDAWLEKNEPVAEILTEEAPS